MNANVRTDRTSRLASARHQAETRGRERREERSLQEDAGYCEEGGERITLLWRDYQRGLDYQRASGLSDKLPEYVRFYEGKQWPAPTKATKNFPRPVVNIVKMICRNKKSAILSSKVRLVYAATRREVDVEAFNRFADYIVKEIGQEALDKLGIQDAIVKGTYVYHYYWDTEARGRTGVELGGLRCEVIDPLSVFFANPKEPDEQKQKWIMIALRQDVASVRAKADRDVAPEDIMPDEATDENPYDATEQEGDDLCTVLIRYFRRDGEVYCEKATKSVMVNRAFPITPDFEGAMRRMAVLPRQDMDTATTNGPYVSASRGEGTEQACGASLCRAAGVPQSEHSELWGFAAERGEVPTGKTGTEEGMDAPNGTAPDDASGTGEAMTLRPRGARAHLYPIVVGNYERREGSIYGLGEVEGLIPNQRAINFNLAMLLLNAQQMAWGKYVVHPDALQGQVITNEPGQTITDYTGTGVGIKKLAEVGASSQPLQLVETITQLTRSVTGSSEVMTGETLGANMSGAAIAQLQSQAQQPIEELRDSFWLVKEKQGKVLAQFFKLFYRDAEYSYEKEASLPMQAGGGPYVSASRDKRPGTEQIGNDNLHRAAGVPQSEHSELWGFAAERGEVPTGGMMPAQASEGKRVVSARFTGADYADVEFDVTCEAMSGTKFSTAGDINVLDVLFAKAAITLPTYIEAYPDDALSNKSKLLELIEREKADRELQLQQQLQQTQAQLQQSTLLLEQQQETVDKVVSLIQQNNQLKAMLGNLFAEANAKIEASNAQVEAGNERLGEVLGDARMFAEAIERMEGGEQHGMPQVQNHDAAAATW